MLKGLFSSLFMKVEDTDAAITNQDRLEKAFRSWFYENDDFLAVFDEDVKKRYRDKFKPSHIQDEYFLALYCIESVLTRWLIENDYAKALKSKQDQLIYQDDYGDLNYDDWSRELDRFIKKREQKFHSYYLQFHSEELSNFCRKSKYHHLEFYNEIDGYGDPCLPIETLHLQVWGLLDSIFHDNEVEKASTFDSNNPYEYEEHIAKLISKFGWDARVTQGSGDQGVDVIAVKGDKRVAVQCKLYSQPVGNKAVQEAHAGMGFYGCNVSAVVTNNTFTKSARQLASSLDVILIENSQVQDFFGGGWQEEPLGNALQTQNYEDTTEADMCLFDNTLDTIQSLYITQGYSEVIEQTKDDHICFLSFCRNQDFHKVIIAANDKISFDFLLELMLAPLELDDHNIVRILLHNDELSEDEILEAEQNSIITIPSSRLEILSNIV